MLQFISKAKNLSKTPAYFTAAQLQHRGIFKSQLPIRKLPTCSKSIMVAGQMLGTALAPSKICHILPSWQH